MARDFVPLPAGARGYLLGERSAQQAGQHEVGMLANLMELEGRRRAQLQEQAFRGELDALGPNPSQDSLAAIATKYARNPDTILRVHQGSLDRAAQIADRQAAREQMFAFQRENKEREFAQRESMMGVQKQVAEARIASISDEATRKRERDAWDRKHADDMMSFRREQELFKQTTLQQGAGLSGEAAGKVAMADQAVMDIRELRELIYNVDGSLKKDVVAAMNAPFTAGLPGNEAARKAFSKIRNAISAKYRIETGAAGSVAEMDDLAKRFMPQLGDIPTPGVVKDRIDRLEQFMNIAIDQTKGVRIDALESRKGKKPPVGGVPRVASDAEYDALPSGAMFIDPEGKTRRKP